jgi:hypothetical protein
VVLVKDDAKPYKLYEIKLRLEINLNPRINRNDTTKGRQTTPIFSLVVNGPEESAIIEHPV